MDVWEKLKTVSINMPFEAAEDVNPGLNHLDVQTDLTSLRERFPITHAHLPNGRTVPLLKTMQTSFCERDCNYCVFRSDRDTPRANLTSDELAAAVDKLARAKIAQGVFLSSGLSGGGVRTQDRIITTADILRSKYHYAGYIHLKIMPGAQKDQILRAMQLADRVSINLEGPNETCLRKLAPHKVFFEELLRPLKIIEEIRQAAPPRLAWKNSWPSSCTQFVVGAVDETDLDLLQMTDQLHKIFKITRAYYSKFSPVINTPFEALPPLNTRRQHRLYQAFYLLRDYHFGLEEIEFNPTGHLSLQKDPKLVWAEQNLCDRPIEINQADFRQLLRIPGVGPVTAQRLIHSRGYGKIREISTLKKIGVQIERASPFILLDGVKPPSQPGLFSWDLTNNP